MGGFVNGAVLDTNIFHFPALSKADVPDLEWWLQASTTPATDIDSDTATNPDFVEDTKKRCAQDNTIDVRTAKRTKLAPLPLSTAHSHTGTQKFCKNRACCCAL